MVFIRKRDGELEEFDRDKIYRSICYAGGDEKTAREISDRINVVEGIDTDQIRNFVIEELRKIDPVAASCYQKTLRFIANEALDLERGVAKISEKVMHRLRIRPGDTFHIVSGDRSILVVAQKAGSDSDAIGLSKDDLVAIGIHPGKKVGTRKELENEEA